MRRVLLAAALALLTLGPGARAQTAAAPDAGIGEAGRISGARR